jgi:transcriptional regulator with XRE-family HTH domain
MAEGDSPTIARRRVRIAIREARESVGLTQQQVAEEMEWSASKVIRIESGDVTISVSDLRQLLGFLGVRDKARINELANDARIARTRAKAQSVWWQEERFRKYTSDDLRRYIEYETEASEIRSLSIFYLPGPLQTPAYAAALTGGWGEEDEQMPPEKIAILVEARQLRHEALLRRIGSVKVLVVMDQSVLMRAVGGEAVFIDQLRQLIDLSERGLVDLRMLPFDIDVPIANNGSYDLMTVGANLADGEVMYRENGMSDEIVENRAETARHRKRFEQLWQAADDENDTIEFVKSRITDLEKKLSDRQG